MRSIPVGEFTVAVTKSRHARLFGGDDCEMDVAHRVNSLFKPIKRDNLEIA
jgi:hypothetical protein